MGFDSLAEEQLFKPLAEDSYGWVEARVKAALLLLQEANLKTAVWETPHYIASDIANRCFANIFKTTIGRVLYFDQERQIYHAQQFFPYVIHADVYGQKILPENLGCVSPVPWFNHPVKTINDVLDTAKRNLIMRDAWASMYYHPYLGLEYLQQVVGEIKRLGYEFVEVSPDLN